MHLGKEYSDSSMLFYACYELRNLLEKLEYDFILASIKDADRPKAVAIANSRDGLKNLGRMYHKSFYHYLNFLKILLEINFIKPPQIADINLKTIHNYIEKLNPYVHLFQKNHSDLMYGSNFTVGASNLINEILIYLKDSQILTEGGISIAGVTVNDFKGSTLDIYERFQKKKILAKDLKAELIHAYKDEHGSEPIPFDKDKMS